MSRSFMSKLSIVATSLPLGLIVLASVASADIGWIVQPQSVLGVSATITLPAFDPLVPGVPNPNSASYVPPITITSIPQTDIGTSGDPALGDGAVNSLMGTGVGYFNTVGNTFTTSIDFGSIDRPHDTSDLTISAVPIGNFYPSTIESGTGAGVAPTFNTSGQPVYNFGTLSSVISAATLKTQMPLTGNNALTGSDFSTASLDNGRIAGFGLASAPYSAGAIPVVAGSFDASKLSFWETFGASLNVAVAADPQGFEGVIPQAQVLTPAIVGINPADNAIAGATGAITRSGPDYILTAPFNYNFVLAENTDGSPQITLPLNISLVAKANIVPGDVNFDGKVDINDLTLIANNWLQSDSSHLGPGDANGDGRVDINDITLLANNWLKNAPALPGGGDGSVTPSSVPEPSSLWLLTIGAVAMLFVVCRSNRIPGARNPACEKRVFSGPNRPRP